MNSKKEIPRLYSRWVRKEALSNFLKKTPKNVRKIGKRLESFNLGFLNFWLKLNDFSKKKNCFEFSLDLISTTTTKNFSKKSIKIKMGFIKWNFQFKSHLIKIFSNNFYSKFFHLFFPQDFFLKPKLWKNMKRKKRVKKFGFITEIKIIIEFDSSFVKQNNPNCFLFLGWVKNNLKNGT